MSALYLFTLASPKYILPSVVAVTIFAMAGMTPLWQRAPLALVGLCALPWVVCW